MHLGLVMECDYRYGTTQEGAFEEAFDLVETAETGGLDGVWLAERHVVAPGRPLDAFGAGIPSIASAPLVLASAMAARTTPVRIDLAVSVLPLCHPIRMAEEAATVDQSCRLPDCGSRDILFAVPGIDDSILIVDGSPAVVALPGSEPARRF